MDAELHDYKGFSVQSLVIRHYAGSRRSNDRLYDVAVRISRTEGAAHASAIFRLENVRPFEHIGDARRAGTAHAHQLINSNDAGLPTAK